MLLGTYLQTKFLIPICKYGGTILPIVISVFYIYNGLSQHPG